MSTEKPTNGLILLKLCCAVHSVEYYWPVSIVIEMMPNLFVNADKSIVQQTHIARNQFSPKNFFLMFALIGDYPTCWRRNLLNVHWGFTQPTSRKFRKIRFVNKNLHWFGKFLRNEIWLGEKALWIKICYFYFECSGKFDSK